MDLIDSDLYHDLDGFHEEEQKKSKELIALESKVISSLQIIDTLKTENKDLTKKIKTIEVNFQNLLDTAKAEIERNGRLIAQLRKEKDDMCFRRKHIRPAAESVEQQQNAIAPKTSNGNFRWHNHISRSHLKTEMYENTNIYAIADMQANLAVVSTSESVEKLAWIKYCDKISERSENSSNSGQGRQYSNERKPQRSNKHGDNVDQNRSRGQEIFLHGKAFQNTSAKVRARSCDRKRYLSGERDHCRSREREDKSYKGRENDRLPEQEPHSTHQQRRTGSHDQKGCRLGDREQHYMREHKFKNSHDQERHRSRDRARQHSGERDQHRSREKKKRSLEHKSQGLQDQERNHYGRRISSDDKISVIDISSSKGVKKEDSHERKHVNDYVVNCTEDLKQVTSKKLIHGKEEHLELSSTYEQLRRTSSDSNVVEDERNPRKTTKEEIRMPSVKDNEERVAKIESKFLEAGQTVEHKQAKYNRHKTAVFESREEEKRNKVAKPQNTVELVTDENSNFASVQQLNTPKKVALYDALFGPSPSTENVSSKLLTNVMEILRNGNDSATTLPGTYSNGSEKGGKKSAQINKKAAVKVKKLTNVVIADYFKENKTMAVCEPETKRQSDLELLRNDGSCAEIFKAVGTFDISNAQCIPALGDFDVLEVDNDIQMQTNLQKSTAKCFANENEIVGNTNDAIVVNANVEKIAVNINSNAKISVEHTVLEVMSDEEIELDSMPQKRDLKDSIQIISDEEIEFDPISQKKDKKERIQIIADIRLPTLFELPAKKKVLQTEKVTQEVCELEQAVNSDRISNEIEDEMKSGVNRVHVEEIVEIVKLKEISVVKRDSNIVDIIADKVLKACIYADTTKPLENCEVIESLPAISPSKLDTDVAQLVECETVKQTITQEEANRIEVTKTQIADSGITVLKDLTLISCIQNDHEIVVDQLKTRKGKVTENNVFLNDRKEESIENASHQTEICISNVQANAFEKMTKPTIKSKESETIPRGAISCKSRDNGIIEEPELARDPDKNQTRPLIAVENINKTEEEETVIRNKLIDIAVTAEQKDDKEKQIKNSVTVETSSARDDGKKQSSQKKYKLSTNEKATTNFVLKSTIEGNDMAHASNDSQTELSVLYEHVQSRDSEIKSAGSISGGKTTIANGVRKEADAETALQIALRQLREIESNSEHRQITLTGRAEAREDAVTFVLNNITDLHLAGATQNYKELNQRKVMDSENNIQNLAGESCDHRKRKMFEIEVAEKNAENCADHESKRLRASGHTTEDVAFEAVVAAPQRADYRAEQQVKLHQIKEVEERRENDKFKPKMRLISYQQREQEPHKEKSAVTSRKKSVAAAENTNNAKKTLKRQITPERSGLTIKMCESPEPIRRCRRRLKTNNALRILDTSSSCCSDAEQQPLLLSTRAKCTKLNASAHATNVNINALRSTTPEKSAFGNRIQASTPTHEIFQREATMERETAGTALNDSTGDAAAHLPLVSGNTSQDAKFNEIDSRLQSMFQSPPYDDAVVYETTADITAQFDNSTKLDTATHLTIDETIDTNASNTTVPPLNASLETKRISLGSSDYRFEKVSDNVVNLYITRKRGKKKKPKAVP